MSETRTLPLAQALPGMLLAAPVLDAGGNVLLPAALTLTENHIGSLPRRGIAPLALSTPAEPADIARKREELRARVMHIFRHTVDDPGSQALLHAVLAFRQASGK